MPVYCSHHPLHYAAFTCPKCHDHLCPSCIVKKKHEFYGYAKDVYLCPKCTAFVDKLSLTHAIEPFWKRLPSIFQYPLHVQPIVLMLALSVIRAFFIEENITSLTITLFCFGILLAYACLALVSSANGRLTPPPVTPAALHKIPALFFKQLALYTLIGLIAYYLITLTFPYFGIEPTPLLASLFIFFILLLLPAVIIMMAVTRSFFEAIIPHIFLLLTSRIGWPYLAMCFFLGLLLIAPSLLMKLIWDTLPTHAASFLATLFTSYSAIVSYHLMGHILFLYHEQAGYKVDYEGDFVSAVNPQASSSGKPSGNPTNDLLHKVNLLIHEGNYDAAVLEIKQSTRGFIHDPLLAERYYSLLYLRKMVPDLLGFAPDYIKLMHKTNQKDKICAAYLFCSQIRPDFLEDDPSSLFITGKTLNENNYPLDALKIFDRFVQIHSDHSMTPNAYFFIARIFNEHLKDPSRAAKIIDWLIETYPFHENASFVQAYAREIKT